MKKASVLATHCCDIYSSLYTKPNLNLCQRRTIAHLLVYLLSYLFTCFPTYLLACLVSFYSLLIQYAIYLNCKLYTVGMSHDKCEVAKNIKLLFYLSLIFDCFSPVLDCFFQLYLYLIRIELLIDST